jgi:ligand-binding sensor domain-containing protein/serine phosphatase RsbU (regulator of sigma subunit)
VRRDILFVLLFFVFLRGFVAQQLRFRHITSEDGLSTNYVSTIFQDNRGFIWFGTQDGLNRYDGYQVRVFKNDPTNENSLSSSDISSLKQVRPDLILVGTRAGLDFFNPVVQSFKRFQDTRLRTKINCMVAFGEERVLAGTEKGLFVINYVQNTAQRLAFGNDSAINVTCLFTHNGNAYVGTQNAGLWLLQKNKLTKVNLINDDHYDLKELESITDIESYGEKLYLGTFGNGIFKIDRNTFEIDDKILFDKNNKEFNYIKNFKIRKNKLYAATGYGVVVYDLISEKKAFYTKGSSNFSLNSILATYVYFDNENNLWVGTNLGGVDVSFSQILKFPLSSFNFETENKNIYSFCDESANNVWVGGLKLLKLINLKTGAVQDYSSKVKENTVLSICKENDNILWIGTWGNGLIRIDRETGQTKSLLSPKLGGTILCQKIHNGDLYVGTVGDGLFKINLKTFEYSNFNLKDGLPNANINTIYEDSKKNIWLGTYDGGLVKMAAFEKDGKLPIEKVFSNSGKKGQIASNIVLDVNEDKDGNIWLATANGLSKYIGGEEFENFYEKDGLANSYLYAILRDSLNHFWLSTNNGIIKFDPRSSRKEMVFKTYGFKDGLVNQEYNMGAALVTESGYMLFGGALGFNAFRQSNIKDNLHAPRVFVINYKRAGNDVVTDSLISYKKHLKLSWNENYFQFEVIALDYTDPSKNKFKYKLEGYDSEWSAPTGIRYISYTQLPGGTYTFKVKAANNDGVWNETPFEINITVVPPFWKTKIFYFLIFLLGGGGIYLYTQHRTKAIKRENKLLEMKVAARTRELAEKNRDITSSIEYAKRIQEAILPSKDQIFGKLKRSFIFYKPKDIVSGDFYWFGEKNEWKIFAIVDCTGHGVPGAFMSMIGHNLLNQIIQERGVTDPGEILNYLHRGVQEALRQGQNEISTNDGMDLSIICIHTQTKETKWAGANRPLILVDSKGTLQKFNGNKFPVGGAQLDNSRVFTTHILKPDSSAMAYMFSDGYADQFGGEKGKKFMVTKFYDILLRIHSYQPEEQKKELEDNFQRWRQNHEQVDDVLVAGIEI